MVKQIINFKKGVSALLAISMLACTLAACSKGGTTSNKGDNKNEDNSSSSGAQTLNIGNPSALGAESDADSVLPVISLMTDSGKAVTTKEYEGTTVSISGATEEECNFSDKTAQIKCRGNHSFKSVDKKSYRVKFDEKINLFNQGRGAAKNWVLMAEHCDQSFLRNHLAFAMAQKLDKIAYTTSSSFVHLYINDKYQGIYRVAEQHQIQESRVDITEDPDTVDTDYFIEWDAYADEDGNVEGLNYFEAGENKFLVKSDYMTEEKCAFLQDYFQKANDAIAGGGKREIEKYIDLDSFIDMYILQECAKNIDVGWSSFFFVKTAGGKISCTCPWDFDLGFGNDHRLDDGSHENIYVGNSEYTFGWGSLDQGNEWFAYLMRNKWFVDKVITRWNAVKSDLEKTALDEAERIYGHFGDEITRNFTVWKIFGKRINQEPDAIRAYRSYGEHVEHLMLWVENRFEWLGDYFSDKNTKYLTTEYEEKPQWKPWW